MADKDYSQQISYGCIKIPFSRSWLYLETFIEEYGNNLIRCFEKIKPLIVVLRLPLAEPSIENIVKLVKFFPDRTDIDSHALCAEFFNFIVHIDLPNKTFEDMEQTAEFSEERKSIIPLTYNCYRLLRTIPVTISKRKTHEI